MEERMHVWANALGLAGRETNMHMRSVFEGAAPCVTLWPKCGALKRRAGQMPLFANEDGWIEFVLNLYY